MDDKKRASFMDAKHKLEAAVPGAKYILLEGRIASWYGVEEGLYKIDASGDFCDPRLKGVKYFNADNEKEVY